MTNDNVISLTNPEQIDPLQELLKDGARRMLASAIEVEVAAFIHQHSTLRTEDDNAVVVRNGYLPKRSIQTGLGDIDVQVPNVSQQRRQHISHSG